MTGTHGAAMVAEALLARNGSWNECGSWDAAVRSSFRFLMQLVLLMSQLALL